MTPSRVLRQHRACSLMGRLGGVKTLVLSNMECVKVICEVHLKELMDKDVSFHCFVLFCFKESKHN